VPEEKLREVRVQRVVDETQSKIADTFNPCACVSSHPYPMHFRALALKPAILGCLFFRSDWKVWIGVLLVISVATAVLGHVPAGSDGTYSV
jgi:hypothetical protein